MKNNVAQRNSSVRSKSCKSFLQSPTRRSEGTAQKLNLGKSQDDIRTLGINCGFGGNDNIREPDFVHNNPENDMYPEEVELDGGLSNLGDDSDDDDDDPWKPLNPHEPGDLKVKPFKKGPSLPPSLSLMYACIYQPPIVGLLFGIYSPFSLQTGKICGKQRMSSTKLNYVAVQFPIAKLDRTINPEFEEALEAQLHAREKLRASQSPPLYDKVYLCASVCLVIKGSCNVSIIHVA